MPERYLGQTPREGARARKTGTPSGKYPSEAHLGVREGAAPRKTGAPREAYPSESQLRPREGNKAKLGQAGDAGTPDIPAANKVPPVITRPTPRPNDIAAPGGSVPRQRPPK